MTLNRDPDVVCFKHCERRVFVFVVPSHCPVCQQRLTQSSNFLPFTLPCPFVNATQSPCSVVLRSSCGDFLSNFQNSINLHIALTDSCGSIIEFDSPGLLWTLSKQVDKALWRQSLLIMQVPESWYNEWDQTLRNVIEQGDWRRRRYDDDNMNCFSFVLDFLRLLKYQDHSEFVNDKGTFSKNFVVPKTTYAAKYITIFRRIKELGCWSELCDDCDSQEL